MSHRKGARRPPCPAPPAMLLARVHGSTASGQAPHTDTDTDIDTDIDTDTATDTAL